METPKVVCHSLPGHASETNKSSYKVSKQQSASLPPGVKLDFMHRPAHTSPCARCVRNPRVFVACLSLLVFTQALLMSGYTSGVLDDLEKVFSLHSSKSGLMVASFQFSSLIGTGVVAFIGGRSHRPRLIGLGGILCGVGSLLFILPHFLGRSQLNSATVGMGVQSIVPFSQRDDELCTIWEGNTTAKAVEKCEGQQLSWAYGVLVTAALLVGIGSAPMYTLGPTYIYDAVAVEQFSVYSGLIYCFTALGPAAGYLVASAFQSVPLTGSGEYSPRDPRYVGTWWAGFIMCAGMLIVFSLPFFCFPRMPQRLENALARQRDPFTYDDESCQDENGRDVPMKGLNGASREECEKDVMGKRKLEEERRRDEPPAVVPGREFGKSPKEIPRELHKLLTNMVWLLTTLGTVGENGIVMGLIAFFAKFLQSAFLTSGEMAGILTGVVVIPSACTGVLAGSLIIRRRRHTVRQNIVYVLITTTISLVVAIPLFFLWCEGPPLIGAAPHTGYFGPAHDVTIKPEAQWRVGNCSLACSCDVTAYGPVCGEDGLSYLSPCLAGCIGFNTSADGIKNFHGCSCQEDSALELATGGKCDQNCPLLYPFLITLFITILIGSSGFQPTINILLGCVPREKTSFSIGIQGFVVRALAFIPAPIYFGSLIDSTCIVWGTECNAGRRSEGACLDYATRDLGTKVFLLVIGLRVAGLICMFCLYLWTRRTRTIKFGLGEVKSASTQL